MTEAQFDPGSFRDPDSRVYWRDGQVYRGLSGRGTSAFDALRTTDFFGKAVADGKIIGTEQVSEPELLVSQFDSVLRHAKVPVISYPYEWPFSMLKEAALLTLDITKSALAEGFITKDASAFNVQYLGVNPVFIDVGSFEPLPPGEAWYGYRQFCEHFLFPLMLQAYAGVDFQPWWRGTADGVALEQADHLLAASKRRRGVLTHVRLHAGLQRRAARRDAPARTRRELAGAGFKPELIAANVRSLQKLVANLEWEASASTWSDYRQDNSYSDADASAKKTFVQDVCAQTSPTVTWDLGANDGFYSRIVAQHGGLVVAVDSDPLSVDRMFRELREEGVHNVLPLVVDLANPSPGLGWRHEERRALERRGQPDLALVLALVHHLSISASIPLDQIAAWMHDLGSKHVVVELPLRSDPQVRRLLDQKQHADEFVYSMDKFESAVKAHFAVAARTSLPSGHRVIYHLTPLDG